MSSIGIDESVFAVLAEFKLLCTILYTDCFFRVVKLSSPNLNYIIIAGVALLYISVYMYTFTAEVAPLQTLLCNVGLLCLVPRPCTLSFSWFDDMQ